jgi:60 kDa SS-A/Ro ribonucleoprotein
MRGYAKAIKGEAERTPQTVPIPGREQEMKRNEAGGYSFRVGQFDQLMRFLVLGSDSGTFYTDPRTLTKQNAKVVLECARENLPGTIKAISDVLTKRLAYKPEAAIFAMGLLASESVDFRREVYKVVPNLNTASHLFLFQKYLDDLDVKWSRSRRTAFANWYLARKPEDLAYQTVKYQSRYEWSHKDVLRLSHASDKSQGSHNLIFRYAVGKTIDTQWSRTDKGLKLLDVYEEIKGASKLASVINLITDNKLTWEMVPGQWLGSPDVWSALLPHMPMTAMLRNMARMSANGLISPMSDAARTVRNKLQNIKGVHPIQVLISLKMYSAGKPIGAGTSNRPVGNTLSTWIVDQPLVGDLNSAFYASFGSIPKISGKTLVAVDNSGSMSSNLTSHTPLSAAEAGAAQAMVFARCADEYNVVGYSDDVTDLRISPNMTLDEVMRQTANKTSSGTNNAAPIHWARAKKISVDAFVEITDTQTWSGRNHVAQELTAYREWRKSGSCKFVEVATSPTSTANVDPADNQSISVVGFNPQVPSVIASFINGLASTANEDDEQ